MAIIDQLSVSLVARTEGWSKGLKRARKELSGFAGSVASSAAKAAGLVGGLVGAGSVAGITALVSHQFEAIDSTLKLARRLKTTTEFLTGYGFAAEQSGISTENLYGAFEELTKNSEMAAKGVGRSQLAFQDLGIDAAAFTKLPLDQKIAILTDRFSQMDDAGRAAFDATKLFGGSGNALLTLLQSGTGAAKDLMDQAKRLGITFSDIDATKVEAANDAFNAMQKVAVGAATTLAVDLAPLVAGIASHFTEAAVAGGNVGDRIVSSMRKAAESVSWVVDLVSGLTAGWYGFQAVVQSVAAFIVSGFQKAGAAVDSLLNLIPGLKPSAANQAQFKAEQDGLKDLALRFQDAADASFASMEKNWAAFSEGGARTAAQNLFKGFVDEGNKLIAQASQATPARTGGLPAATMAAAKVDPFAARGIDFSNTYFGAVQGQSKKQQTVNDPAVVGQLKTTNNLLRKLGGAPRAS